MTGVRSCLRNTKRLSSSGPRTGPTLDVGSGGGEVIERLVPVLGPPSLSTINSANGVWLSAAIRNPAASTSSWTLLAARPATKPSARCARGARRYSWSVLPPSWDGASWVSPSTPTSVGRC